MKRTRKHKDDSHCKTSHVVASTERKSTLTRRACFTLQESWGEGEQEMCALTDLSCSYMFSFFEKHCACPNLAFSDTLFSQNCSNVGFAGSGWQAADTSSLDCLC